MRVSDGRESTCEAACECCKFLGQEKATRIAKKLEEEGIRVFIDYDSMVEHGAPGKQGVLLTTAKNIEASAAVIICCSEEYDKRPNCTRELGCAMFLSEPGGKGRPVPPFAKDVFFVNCGEPGFDPMAASPLFRICMERKLWFHNQSEDAWATKHGWAGLWASLKTCTALKKALKSKAGSSGGGGGGGGGR